MAVESYTKSGNKASAPAKLDKAVFGLKVSNHQLLQDAYLAYLAAGRATSAKAKSRGEVQGGGRKPWRQKGTGRARFGSSRNPLWRGGGAAFGPTGEENYDRKVSLKAKRLALRQALSLAASENRIKTIENLSFTSPKTKEAARILSKIQASGNVLLVSETKDENIVRAVRNLSTVKLVHADYLNIFDVLNADNILLTAKALDKIHQRLGT